MSYQVLARKWRPHQFDDVVGQSHVLTALANALAHDRLHHAYLFSGTRGVGKTTIARIFAKGLNCEQGITASPCGQCDTCREIEEGRFVDLLEIDAASRTKVEDTRELLDNVQYKPARGRFKVYLIDEVHMLSRHSFNALLKTLEEPPEYVKFILATTDPQKLPVTILSRCLQFHLKHLDATQIQDQLANVLTHEQVEFEPRALSLLARAADGSMRDALSLTDQAIALGNGNVAADPVAMMLGTLDTDQALHLLEAVAQGEAQIAMANVSELAGIGVEWDSLLRELAAQLHRVAMYQALPASLDMTLPDAERIAALSKAMSPQDVQLSYQIALQGRQDMVFAPEGRTGLEMVLLRMLAFRPVAGQGITPQVITVPSSEPAAPQMAAPQSMAPQAPVQSMERVQALKQRMQPQSQPQHAPVEAQPMVSSQSAATPQTTAASPAPAAMAPSAPVQPQGYSPAPVATPAAEPAAVPVTESQPASAPSRSGVSGLLAARNGLRSHKQRGEAPAAPAVKKTEPTPAKKVANNVLERIAQKHPKTANGHTAMPASSGGLPPHLAQSQASKEPEEYQWKATHVVDDSEAKAKLSPKILKQALEHEKTPEMIKQLVNEAANQDSWSDLVTKLNVGRLVQQLALNSAFKQEGQQVTLCLRAAQGHLDSPKAREQLQQAISEHLEQSIELTIELSDEGQTPLEWRDAIYQQKLGQAKQSLMQDPNVKFICQRFAAALDEESIRPI
ncbi:DNA polymerase III subunit gamma/tau [Photobacterium jeanii]|uniref:DNA polymerase III subunit gamma/tau n=1 Tax=Photobacterium jeanii TaxID=858640 RepID=A0A178KMC3_9GAMM|nr:DNA polymerase III subunit gamma/tau [Photobacterium jeanii]OAN18528.1 DNA polymerase III subunit gamma/tau [Photobacterium jeanii]PST91790.1 DNA polymerase III subunit gamma/tau [Photobacterium jeanii]